MSAWLMKLSLTIFLISEAITDFGSNQMSYFFFIGLNLERGFFWNKCEEECSSSYHMYTKVRIKNKLRPRYMLGHWIQSS